MKFSHVVLELSFTQFKVDYSLFTKGLGNTFITLLAYVDDIIVISLLSHVVTTLKHQLHN